MIHFPALTGIISANGQAKIAAATTENSLFADDTESGVIQGRIITTDDQPAAYVSVGLKEINRFTITDEKGIFSIRNIKPGVYTLQVSMAGLQAQEKEVNVKSEDAIVVDFTLVENQKQLEEVVITSRKTLNQTPVSIGKIIVDPLDLHRV